MSLSVLLKNNKWTRSLEQGSCYKNSKEIAEGVFSILIMVHMYIYHLGLDLDSMNLRRPSIGVIPVPAAIKYMLFTDFSCNLKQFIVYYDVERTL